LIAVLVIAAGVTGYLLGAFAATASAITEPVITTAPTCRLSPIVGPPTPHYPIDADTTN
jgi:hypothetical protein